MMYIVQFPNSYALLIDKNKIVANLMQLLNTVIIYPNILQTWDLSSGCLQHSLRGHTGPVTGCQLTTWANTGTVTGIVLISI